MIVPLSRIVGVAFTPPADRLRSLCTGGPLLLAGRDAGLPCRESTPAAIAMDGEAVGGEGALVLADLVREGPILERPIAALRGGASAPAAASTNSSYAAPLLAPWNAASWWTILSVPGVTYLLTSAGSTVRANCPQIGHWKSDHSSRVTGAVARPSVRSAASSIGVGDAGAIERGRGDAGRGRHGLRSTRAPATSAMPTAPTRTVIRRIGDPRRRVAAQTLVTSGTRSGTLRRPALPTSLVRGHAGRTAHARSIEARLAVTRGPARPNPPCRMAYPATIK